MKDTYHLLCIVARFCWPFERSGDVGRTEVDLWTVVDHEGVVTTALILSQYLWSRNQRWMRQCMERRLT
jgi:hypothetical protein